MEATTGSAAAEKGSGRETRRRRIADRGSDRLALITGRIKNLPSESESESGSNQTRGGHSYTASCPPLMNQIHLSSSDQSSQSFNSTAFENKSAGPLLTEHDSARETVPQPIPGGRVGPYMRKCESSMEASKAPPFDVDVRGRPSRLTSMVENVQVPESNTDHGLSSHSHANKLAILRDVSSSITATERIRTLSSLAMSILVVLSYIGFPIVGSNVLKSVISFRPLYLVLLTNITIVIAQLLPKLRSMQRPEPEHQATGSPAGEDGLFDQLGKALEIGLTLQNLTSAVFMDCSIYSIAVTCFLSLAQRLGW